MNVDCWIPGLLMPLVRWGQRQGWVMPRGDFSRWRYYGRLRRHDQLFGYRELAMALGLSETALSDLRALGLDHPLRADGWLCADPVILHPGLNRLLLQVPEGDEKDRLMVRYRDDVRSFFQASGWSFQDHPGGWYVRPPAEQAWTGWPPLAERSSNEVENLFMDPQIPDSTRRFLTELQMWLTTLDSPTQTLDEVNPRMNCLWLWGADRVKGTGSPQWSRLYSDDPVVIGMAKAGSLDWRSISTDELDLGSIDEEGASLSCLIHWTGFYQPMLDQDMRAWLEALDEWLEWCSGLLAALSKRQITTLTLHDGSFSISLYAPRWFRRRWREFGEVLESATSL